jgi:tetratricopeptide (TPR) repeat protein
VEQEVKKMRYYRYECKYEFRPQKSRSAKRAFLFLLIVLGLSLLSVNTADAQVRENARRELEKTATVIQRAEDAVSESRNFKAESLLKMAVELQEQATIQFHGMRYRHTVELTLKAREKAYQAIGFTRRDEENENLVSKAIERTDHVMSKAKEVATGVENRRVLSLFEMAINHQQKAKEFLREHRLKMALKFTLKAREMAQKLLNLANGERGLDRLALRKLETTRRLIEKAFTLIHESRIQKAEQLLEQARNMQQKARDMADEKRHAEAIKNAEKARELAQKALRLVEEDVTPQMAENAIQQNERLIEKATEKMKASANQEAQATFEKGLSHQSRAKEYYGDGKFKTALAEAKVARRLISKALEMIDGSQL